MLKFGVCHGSFLTQESSIDEADHSGIREIIDKVEAAVVLVKAEHVLKWESESVAEDHAVDRPVTDNQEIPAFLVAENTPETSHHPFGQLGNGLPVSRRPEAHRIFHASLNECRETLANVLEAESFPVSEAEFPQLRTGPDGHIVILSDDARSLYRSLEVAAVDGLDLRKPETIGEVLEMENTHLGEGHVGVSVNGKSLVTVHLAVSDQI